MEELSFNTASGKHYCNRKPREVAMTTTTDVSIPQAVSTIATLVRLMHMLKHWKLCFNTASGKHYCNDITETFQIH